MSRVGRSDNAWSQMEGLWLISSDHSWEQGDCWERCEVAEVVIKTDNRHHAYNYSLLQNQRWLNSFLVTLPKPCIFKNWQVIYLNSVSNKNAHDLQTWGCWSHVQYWKSWMPRPCTLTILKTLSAPLSCIQMHVPTLPRRSVWTLHPHQTFILDSSIPEITVNQFQSCQTLRGHSLIPKEVSLTDYNVSLLSLCSFKISSPILLNGSNVSEHCPS